MSPFYSIIKGVRENIRVAYTCRNGDKTALLSLRPMDACFSGRPLLSPRRQSPASLFLHVPSKGRPEPDVVRLQGICPLSCTAGDKMGVRGQNGSAGTKSEGGQNGNAGTISGIPLPPRTSQSPMPCGSRAFVPCDVWRGQIRGDKSEGTNQSGDKSERGQNRHRRIISKLFRNKIKTGMEFSSVSLLNMPSGPSYLSCAMILPSV